MRKLLWFAGLYGSSLAAFAILAFGLRALLK
jgi:hypothetical protein